MGSCLLIISIMYFPYDNLVVGAMVIVVGFVFHWLGQLTYLLNSEFAAKIGLVEPEILPEYEVYERAIAKADVAIGWLYGIAGVGMILGAHWGYKLAWFPGCVFVSHSISFWFWTENRRRAGHKLMSDAGRIGWFVANFITGILAIAIAGQAN